MMMIDAAAAVLEACSSSDVRACATAGKRPYEQSWTVVRQSFNSHVMSAHIYCMHSGVLAAVTTAAAAAAAAVALPSYRTKTNSLALWAYSNSRWDAVYRPIRLLGCELLQNKVGLLQCKRNAGVILRTLQSHWRCVFLGEPCNQTSTDSTCTKSLTARQDFSMNRFIPSPSSLSAFLSVHALSYPTRPCNRFHVTAR